MITCSMCLSSGPFHLASFSRSIYVVTNGKISFFLIGEIIFYCIYLPYLLLIHPFQTALYHTALSLSFSLCNFATKEPSIAPHYLEYKVFFSCIWDSPQPSPTLSILPGINPSLQVSWSPITPVINMSTCLLLSQPRMSSHPPASSELKSTPLSTWSTNQQKLWQIQHMRVSYKHGWLFHTSLWHGFIVICSCRSFF